MTVRKTIRILGISLALIALLVFATGVVSDWHHSDSTNDARCPYCHLGHQTPIQAEAPLCVAVLSLLLFCHRRKKLLQHGSCLLANRHTRTTSA